MKTFRITYFFLLCLAGAYLAPMHAQESCYEQYLREHNKKILTAEDVVDFINETMNVPIQNPTFSSE